MQQLLKINHLCVQMHCTMTDLLPQRSTFCIVGGLLSAGEKSHARGRGSQAPDRGHGSAKADSPQEKARRLGSTPVGALPVQMAPRQVGPLEFDARNAAWGQRAFSWLLFS